MSERELDKNRTLFWYTLGEYIEQVTSKHPFVGESDTDFIERRLKSLTSPFSNIDRSYAIFYEKADYSIKRAIKLYDVTTEAVPVTTYENKLVVSERVIDGD